jgi:hypothetical protein
LPNAIKVIYQSRQFRIWNLKCSNKKIILKGHGICVCAKKRGGGGMGFPEGKTRKEIRFETQISKIPNKIKLKVYLDD